ncbi:MAG: hypothetical protein F6K00_27045 [Leptolyngbya sp. SIOISBB]|nr:hypothetical protein [Leptolyngbya sp. SIOISBB]
MLRSICTTVIELPARAWDYGQRYPYEAIVYGLVLAALAMVSKLLLALLAYVVVASGIVGSLRVR